jgi:glutamate--cysteine ligase
MGIITVTDGSEVRMLNRRQRNKMAVVKKGLQVTEVVQEEVYTFERVNEAVAEPVIYMIDPFVVGRFYGCIPAAVSMKTLMRRECSSYRSLSKIHARCRIGMRGRTAGCNRFYAYG